ASPLRIGRKSVHREHAPSAPPAFAPEVHRGRGSGASAAGPICLRRQEEDGSVADAPRVDSSRALAPRFQSGRWGSRSCSAARPSRRPRRARETSPPPPDSPRTSSPSVVMATLPQGEGTSEVSHSPKGRESSREFSRFFGAKPLAGLPRGAGNAREISASGPKIGPSADPPAPEALSPDPGL